MNRVMLKDQVRDVPVFTAEPPPMVDVDMGLDMTDSNGDAGFQVPPDSSFIAADAESLLADADLDSTAEQDSAGQSASGQMTSDAARD